MSENVTPKCILFSIAGKTKTINALKIHCVNTGIDIAVPLTLFGNISDMYVQKTGPMDDEKEIRKTIISINTNSPSNLFKNPAIASPANAKLIPADPIM